MKKIVLLALGLVAVATTHAQDEKAKVETTIAADFVNQYIWRGLDCGNVSIQPTLGIGYKGLSLSAWGNVGVSKDDVKEFDLTLGYTTGGFNIGITDYWSTNHVFEANIGYDFGVLNLQWYTNFAGNDGYNKNDKRAYSSYAQVDVPFKLVTVDWTATAGVVPYYSTYYGTTGFAVTNLSLRADKDIKITDSFSIPVFGQIVANPCTEKAYLVFGFTLHP